MELQTVMIGGREAWVVRDGEETVALVFDEGGEFVAMMDGEELACDQTMNGAVALALNKLGYPLETWPASAQTAFEGKVMAMATHPDDWEQW